MLLVHIDVVTVYEFYQVKADAPVHFRSAAEVVEDGSVISEPLR